MKGRTSGIDVADEIVELRFQVLRTQLILEMLSNKHPDILSITAEELYKVEKQALKAIQEKYPNVTIRKRGGT